MLYLNHLEYMHSFGLFCKGLCTAEGTVEITYNRLKGL